MVFVGGAECICLVAAAIGFSSSLAICQCRGENGELRVGVRRRLGHQQNPIPSSVISSQSMHLGVLATARHAVNTNTIFVVYYKPRFEYFFFFLESCDHTGELIICFG